MMYLIIHACWLFGLMNIASNSAENDVIFKLFCCLLMLTKFLIYQVKSKGVTMTALLAKATALALAKHPVVNSSCRDGKSFTYNSSINIAVAVALDGGLITPVLQDADKVCVFCFYGNKLFCLVGVGKPQRGIQVFDKVVMPYCVVYCRLIYTRFRESGRN